MSYPKLLISAVTVGGLAVLASCASAPTAAQPPATTSAAPTSAVSAPSAPASTAPASTGPSASAAAASAGPIPGLRPMTAQERQKRDWCHQNIATNGCEFYTDNALRLQGIDPNG